jgi:putative ABC transport system permease protein
MYRIYIEKVAIVIFLPNDLLNVWLLSLSLSLAAGVYPAWKASRLSALEALRR